MSQSIKNLTQAELAIKAKDYQFKEEIIDSVSENDDYYDIECDGSHLCIPKKPGVVPKAGDTARFYGKGFGYCVRGIDVAGKTVYYRNENQYKQDQKAESLKRSEEKKNNYIKKQSNIQNRVDALPKEFRDRINYFRSRNPNWKYEFETYELFVCEQAVSIGMHLKTTEAINDWKNKSFEEKKKVVPELADGHSCNTFGIATYLANLYWGDPNLICKMHGAMCALVGCKEYGCWASDPNNKKATDNE